MQVGASRDSETKIDVAKVHSDEETGGNYTKIAETDKITFYEECGEGVTATSDYGFFTAYINVLSTYSIIASVLFGQTSI